MNMVDGVEQFVDRVGMVVDMITATLESVLYFIISSPPHTQDNILYLFYRN